MPDASGKTQPDYIPEVLRNDYIEACLIKELSPKSSATLARRCIQGMIRDYCKISKSTLNSEITALRKEFDEGRAPSGVAEESIEAIDHVRKIGNIGAHMERDINIIIDVDPGEAQILIELIEMLFEEWYVARHKRQERLSRLEAIAAEKESIKALGKPPGSDISDMS